VELMLQHELIHGDLSAYNILRTRLAHGAPGPDHDHRLSPGRLSAFQSKGSFIRGATSSAPGVLLREGVRCNPRAIADEMWDATRKRQIPKTGGGLVEAGGSDQSVP